MVITSSGARTGISCLFTKGKQKPGLSIMGLTVLALMSACTQEIRSPQSHQKTIYLDAKSGWQNTGLWCKEGQRVFFKCSGIWAVAPENESNRWPDAGPEGHGKHPGEKIHELGDPKKELPGTPFGTLLGKVSEVAFPIGNRKVIIIPAEGVLSLVINDYPFFRHDNRGGLTITILPSALRTPQAGWNHKVPPALPHKEGISLRENSVVDVSLRPMVPSM